MTVENRLLSDRELVYKMVNSNQIASLVEKNEVLNIDEVLQSMTPTRRAVAESAIELYKRSAKKLEERVTFRSSTDVYSYMYPQLAYIDREEFWIIPLDQANKPIKKVRMFVGGISSTVVDIRLVLKELILSNATMFMAVHNHPSGNGAPSEPDKNLTREMVQASSLLKIKLLDHVIIANEQFYSFADNGLI